MPRKELLLLSVAVADDGVLLHDELWLFHLEDVLYGAVYECCRCKMWETMLRGRDLVDGLAADRSAVALSILEDDPTYLALTTCVCGSFLSAPTRESVEKHDLNDQVLLINNESALEGAALEGPSHHQECAMGGQILLDGRHIEGNDVVAALVWCGC